MDQEPWRDLQSMREGGKDDEVKNRKYDRGREKQQKVLNYQA